MSVGQLHCVSSDASAVHNPGGSWYIGATKQGIAQFAKLTLGILQSVYGSTVLRLTEYAQYQAGSMGSIAAVVAVSSVQNKAGVHAQMLPRDQQPHLVRLHSVASPLQARQNVDRLSAPTFHSFTEQE